MPKMKKIRVTNVNLDKGVKVIPNNIWDLDGNNLLFLLENGGGKTSVIQIIHQMVMPNSNIQGRTISETIKMGTTLHSALEWISDDEDRPNFITGFSLYNHGRKTAQNTTSYEYLSYVYELTDETFEIEELRFLKSDGTVIAFFELETMLKNTPGVRCFRNQPGNHRRELENYGIFESEWQNIAKINGAEGGVQGFFDRSI